MSDRNHLTLIAALLTFVALAPQYVASANEKATEVPSSGSAKLKQMREAPFPELFNDPIEQMPISPRHVRIVTEVIGGPFKRTHEEYVDLEVGRSAYVISKIDVNKQPRKEVLLASSHFARLFRYWPYKCVTMSIDEIANGMDELDHLDYWFMNLNYPNDHGSVEGATDSKVLPLFGVAGMWMLAGMRSKTYSSESILHSTRKDIYRLAHKWTLTDKNGLDITLLFMSPSFSPDSFDETVVNTELSLESIKITIHSTGELLRTINVVSIDYNIDLDAYNNLLEVPAGYGCDMGSDVDLKEIQENINMESEDEFWYKYIWSSSLVDLEVTATKITPVTNERYTDTIYLQMAHLPIDGPSKKYDLMMTKVKSKEKEIKTILDHFYNIKYQIDLQKGSCRMSHISSSESIPSGGKDPDSELSIQFSNGLKLSLERDQVEKLFTNKEKFQLVKMGKPFSGDKKHVARLYLEKTIPKWPYDSPGNTNKIAREIRTLVRSSGDEKFPTDSSTKLESITLWILDAATESQILEIYHINVINEEAPLYAWPDVSRLFDVSQECYLDNRKMRSGIDYAWVEFLFPVSSHQLELLEQNELALKQQIHSHLVTQFILTVSRVPRLELMFSDEGLVVRALLLDLPSLEILYASYESQALHIDSSIGEGSFIAPDLKHCAKLCQMYSCRSFSYCSNTRECLVGKRTIDMASTDVDSNTMRQGVKPTRFCTAFSMPVGDEPRLNKRTFRRRLNKLLDLLSHHDFEYHNVPAPPDELTLPRQESGITSDDEYKTLVLSYLGELSLYFIRRGDTTPIFIISLILNDRLVVLFPAKFTIEDQPLDEFTFPGRGQSENGEQNEDPNNDSSQDDFLFDPSKVVAFFHDGLSMTRYNFNSFRGPLRESSHVLNGLSYDQCALGCLDSKCGTFSYCPSRKECIITSLDTISEATSSKLTESDVECFISQRDFAKNFQKYPDVLRPQTYLDYSSVVSINDCALKCLRYPDSKCISFEYCEKIQDPKQVLKKNYDQVNGCYTQMARHPGDLFSQNTIGKKEAKVSDNSHHLEDEPTGPKCDHYERSYLAEFNHIEAHKFKRELLNDLKTTEFTDTLTPMDCADICLNQLSDCSAFQFCFNPDARVYRLELDKRPTNFALSCLMIQSKPTNANEQKDIEVLIDAKNDQLLSTSEYLEFDNYCQIFALRPDTVQAHLRDLAMGETMTLAAKEQLEAKMAHAGVELSFLGFLMLFLSVALVSGLSGVGLCYARERSDFVREQIDRVRHLVRL